VAVTNEGQHLIKIREGLRAVSVQLPQSIRDQIRARVKLT